MNTGSITAALARCLSPFLGGLLLGLVLAGSSLAYEADLVRGVMGGDPTVERVSHDRLVEDYLIQRHDCWTDAAPADVIPGHVIITIDGEPVLRGERATGRALEQLFDGANHDMTVRAFCP